ncbi:MAG: MarR family transcriptional regulator [Thiotrichales bacterium]|nr:MarR family transcriptional regulator [Thiotrichales bacterium]
MKKPVNIEQTIGFALHHSSYVFKTALKREFNRNGYNISPEEFVMLCMVNEEGIEQGILRDKSLKDKTNITRLLDRMVDKGLIKRSIQKDNRRQQIVKLTARGISTQAGLLKLAKALTQKAGKGLNKEQIELTRKTLLQISRNLDS